MTGSVTDWVTVWVSVCVCLSVYMLSQGGSMRRGHCHDPVRDRVLKSWEHLLNAHLSLVPARWPPLPLSIPPFLLLRCCFYRCTAVHLSPLRDSFIFRCCIIPPLVSSHSPSCLHQRTPPPSLHCCVHAFHIVFLLLLSLWVLLLVLFSMPAEICSAGLNRDWLGCGLWDWFPWSSFDDPDVLSESSWIFFPARLTTCFVVFHGWCYWVCVCRFGRYKRCHAVLSL